jgi:hypothetical protein
VLAIAPPPLTCLLDESPGDTMAVTTSSASTEFRFGLDSSRMNDWMPRFADTAEPGVEGQVWVVQLALEGCASRRTCTGLESSEILRTRCTASSR